MAYVGLPFVHDLFISYSHGDDGNGKPTLKSWTAGFVERLTDELQLQLGQDSTLNIFLDTDYRPGQGVDPMVALAPQLQNDIFGSALLMVLMSPAYLASGWCTREREWWCARQPEYSLPVDGRIVLVKIWPTKNTVWPEQFLDFEKNQLTGFPFHCPIGNVERPIGWVGPREGFKPDSASHVLDIVSRLVPRLDNLKSLLQERRRIKEDAARLTQADDQTIYLHGRTDQAEIWNKAGLALTASGYSVVPGEPDAVKMDLQKARKIREQRVELLSACDAMLLLGTDDGRALDHDLIAIGKHDRQSARSRSNRLLPCGLLNTVGPAITTDVRIENAKNLQADWIDGTQKNWTPLIRQWLKEKSAQLVPKP